MTETANNNRGGNKKGINVGFVFPFGLVSVMKKINLFVFYWLRSKTDEKLLMLSRLYMGGQTAMVIGHS